MEKLGLPTRPMEQLEPSSMSEKQQLFQALGGVTMTQDAVAAMTQSTAVLCAEATPQEGDRSSFARATAHASRGRVLVAVEDLKVRCGVELSSKFITTLPAGTRMHVVETQHTQDGGIRAHVMVAAPEHGADGTQRAMQNACRWRQLFSPNKALGWVTAHGRLGDSLQGTVFNGGKHPMEASTHQAGALSARGKQTLPVDSLRATPAAPAIVSATAAPAPFAAPAPAKKSGLSKHGGLKSLLSKAVAAEGAAVPAAAARDGQRNLDFASLVKAAVKEFSCPGSGLSVKSAHLAVEDACTAILALYNDKKSNVFRTADVEAEVAAIDQAALEEEKAASGSSLSAAIGEVLSAKGGKKLDSLVKEWDPNGDGSVTKQEFRLCVRKLFPKPPDVKEVDMLFGSLDTESSGDITMGQLKRALKKMISAHANRKATGDSAMAKAKAKREQAKALREGSVAAAVRASEAAVAAFQELRKAPSLASQLGDLINIKGWKAHDVATKWDESGDGELDKKEFRQNVLKLLPDSEPNAIDAIFDSLDADGGGSLDLAELRKALKRFQEESIARRDQLRVSGLDLIAKFKACRRAQAEHKASATVEAAKEQSVEID